MECESPSKLIFNHIIRYIQKLSFLTPHQLLLLCILCICDVMAVTQIWARNYIALFHSRKQGFKLSKIY